MKPTLRKALSLAGLLALLSAAPAALGQSSQMSAAAQAAFDEAMKLMKEGHTAEACPKFEAAQHLDPGMATQFRLAECYEKIGRFASAWAAYVEVADAAKAAKMSDREAVARKRAAALEPRLSRLTIVVPKEVADLDGIEITRDGVAVERSLWGTALPVDPGEHTVSVKATGKKTWEGKGAAGQVATKLEVAIPPMEDLPKPPELPQSTSIPPPAEIHKRSPVPALAMGAGAVVALATGVGLFVASNSKQNAALTLDKQIGRGGCYVSPPDSRCAKLDSMAQSVDTFRYVSVGTFIGAGVLAAGALTYLLWPTPKPKPPKTGLDVHASPVVGGHDGGMMLWGSF